MRCFTHSTFPLEGPRYEGRSRKGRTMETMQKDRDKERHPHRLDEAKFVINNTYTKIHGLPLRGVRPASYPDQSWPPEKHFNIPAHGTSARGRLTAMEKWMAGGKAACKEKAEKEVRKYETTLQLQR